MEERLQLILDNYRISASKLADILNIQRSGISHILAGRNKPSYDFLQRLINHFPEIDANWLLTGKGSIYKDDLKNGGEDAKSNPLSDIQSKPENAPRKGGEAKSISLGDTPEITEVYKGKQTDSHNRGMEGIIVLYTDGTFRRYTSE